MTLKHATIKTLKIFGFVSAYGVKTERGEQLQMNAYETFF